MQSAWRAKVHYSAGGGYSAEMAESDPMSLVAKCACIKDAELVIEFGKIQDLHHWSNWEQASVAHCLRTLLPSCGSRRSGYCDSGQRITGASYI